MASNAKESPTSDMIYSGEEDINIGQIEISLRNAKEESETFEEKKFEEQ